MTALQQLFAALETVERFAVDKRLHMSLTACVTCRKATVVLHREKPGFEVLVEVKLSEDGEPSFEWPLASSDEVQAALTKELRRYEVH